LNQSIIINNCSTERAPSITYPYHSPSSNFYLKMTNKSQSIPDGFVKPSDRHGPCPFDGLVLAGRGELVTAPGPDSINHTVYGRGSWFVVGGRRHQTSPTGIFASLGFAMIPSQDSGECHGIFWAAAKTVPAFDI
jgi:hypothetical protein